MTRGATLLLVALALSACGSPIAATTTTPPATTAGAPAAPEEPPPWLTLSLDYSPRHSVGMRRLDVVTRHAGTEDLHVDEIALRAEHFEHLPPDAKASTIRAGSTVNVKAHFGPVANCDTAGPLAASVLVVARIGENPNPHTWATDVDPETLDEIHVSECRAKAVDEAVAIRFDDAWTEDGAAMLTSLILERRGGDDPVALESVQGLTLLAMEAVPVTAGTVAELDAGETVQSAPVRITVWRCDEHVVSQSPDGFTFRAVLRVGDGEPHEVVLRPEADMMERLVALVDACARARDHHPSG